ncbi:MAG: cupin domain-containing protein [Rhizobiales bacterium]|nr:cupin domain-containing protein [Hyphomicrobiales bacterium]
MTRCIRLFTGPDQRSHVEDTALPVGVLAKARVVHFEKSQPHASFDWHTAPCRQYVVSLTGTLEFTTRDGETFTLSAGDVLLAEDTAGSGHRWRLIDDAPWLRLYVELE